MDIRIFDKDINFLGEVDNYTSLFYISKWETYGEFEFHIKNFNRELIKKGNIIMLGKDDFRAGVIEHFEVNQEDDEDITIKGFSLGYWFSNRITVPPVDYAYHSFNTNVEDIILALVKANAADPLDINRKIPNLTIEPSQNRGIKLEFQTRYKNLADELTKLSKASGLGWNITLDYKNKKFVFKVLEGKDLSTEQSINPPQIFSVDYDNVRKQNYLESNIGYKNMAYVAGQGEGVNREVELLNNTLTGFDRRETFIDARDIEQGGNLVDRGKVKLAETPEITTFECEVESAGYKNTWNLGDIVTTINKKMKLIMHNRVKEIREVWEESGYKVEPTFGTTIPTIGEKIKQTQDTPLQESAQGPQGETGERGPQGYSVQYLWSGTKLGIKREDETNYTYVDLKGTKGDIGPKGEQGIQGVKGDIGVGINFLWNGTKLGIKREDESTYQYVDLKGAQGVKGDQGIQGKSLEFNWNGTQLGIRVEGQTSYTYVELKGQKGDQGIQGIQGERGPQGIQGIQGVKGDKGDKIKHQWSGTVLKLENPDGTFDTGVDLKGAKGDKGDTGSQGPQGVQGPAGDGQSYVVFQKYFIAAEGQKIFSWNDGYVYPVGINAIAVYINGTRVGNKAFKELSGNSIEFIDALSNGDNVFIEAMQAVVDLQGPKGDKGDTGTQGIQGIPGKSLEYLWNGTSLGVRQQGETAYTYVDLQGPQGIQGVQGIKGDKGDTGATGSKGDKGDQGIQGVKGADGKSLEFTWNGTQLGVRQQGEISYTYVNLQGPQGIKGDTGLKGDTGAKGDIWRPSVDSSGNLSWTINNGTTAPSAVNIKGPKGDTGATGVQGIQGPKGDKGDPGTTDYNNLLNKPTSLPANGGNASTATKLQTARKINGVSFDGSTDITITADPNTHNHDESYEPKNANIQAHIASAANPHSVTKSQVGLGSVSNYGLATQAEAEAGASSAKYMTPLRVKQAIDKFKPTKLSDFENDIGAGGGTQIIISSTQPTGVPKGTIWI